MAYHFRCHGLVIRLSKYERAVMTMLNNGRPKGSVDNLLISPRGEARYADHGTNAEKRPLETPTTGSQAGRQIGSFARTVMLTKDDDWMK